MKYQYKSLGISYEPHLDGGGIEVYPEFLRVVQENIGKVESLYEFCAGPAFIGFSFLEDGMCKRLVLSDIEAGSIKSCKKTIKENKLEGIVEVYYSDCLTKVPEQKFDLVVGNPPHFSERQENLPQKTVINVDDNWDIHRRFYADIGRYLNMGGFTLFVENGRGSNPELFEPMILDGGLRVEKVLTCNLNRPSKFYFILTKKTKETANYKKI